MELLTTTAVMDALGGTDAVAQMTGRTYSAAFNWRGFDAFPANTFLQLTAALKDRGYTAPASLWRMPEPAVDVSAEPPQVAAS